MVLAVGATDRLQRLLEDPLAEEIISGAFKEGSKVKAERKEEVLVFQT